MQVKTSQKRSQIQMKLSALHVSAGLVAILVAVAVANSRQSSFQTESMELSSSGRKIASVGPVSQVTSSALTEKLILEMKQTQTAQKNAVKPSAMDRLLFETLDGQYSMVTDNGRLVSLELSSERGGIAIESESEFVKANSQVLDLSEVESIESRHDGDRKLTVVAGKTLSSVDERRYYEIATDSEGRLITLKKINQPSL